MVLLFGCSGGDAKDGSYTEIRNTLPPADRIVSAPEVLRIGAPDGSGPDVFGRIRALAVDDAGTVYVLEDMEQQVRVFHADGRHWFTFGRRGEGPGELLGAGSLGRLPDGSIWVWSASGARLTLFDSEGRFTETRSFRDLPNPGTRARPGPDGSMIGLVFRNEGLRHESQITHQFHQNLHVARFSPEVSQVDTLAGLGIERTAFAGNFIVGFQPGIELDFEDDGTLWGSSGPDYRILKLTSSGDTLLAFTVPHDRVPVTTAERDSVVERMPAIAGVRPELDPALIPDSKQAVRLILALGEGWVGVFPEMGGDTGRILDVFSSDGHLVARVRLSTRLSLTPARPYFRAGLLYGVSLDALEIPYVVALDLSDIGIPD